MKKKYIPFYIISLLICFFYVNNLKKSNNIEIKINQIKDSYEGIIIEKFSVRNTPPTHLKIKTHTGVIQICPNQDIIMNSKVGDSLYKIKNENYVYILDSEKKSKKKYFYTKLSNETRNSKHFPKEWKKLWPESSSWELDEN